MTCNLELNSCSTYDFDEDDLDFDSLSVSEREDSVYPPKTFSLQAFSLEKDLDGRRDWPAEQTNKKNSSFHRLLDESEYREVCRVLF